MVRSPLRFPKHLVFAISLLGLSICGVEFGLHLHDACLLTTSSYSERNACAPSWTVHHLLKPDVRITTADPDTGTQISWRTNSLGLRGPEYDIPKPVGVYRIVCLGDDSTLAPETASGETFCTRLQELLATVSPARIEVINAGCPQYGPLLSLLLLKHSLLALSPDLVICNFDMSDVADDHRCRRSVRMNGAQPLYCPHPDLERQRNSAEKLWVERLLMWQHAKHGVKYVLGGEDRPEDNRDIDAPQGTYAWLRDDPPDWSVYIGQTLETIGQLSRVCRQTSGKFVLAVIPAPFQISDDASAGPGVRTRAGVEEHQHYKSRVPFDTLSAYARKKTIRICDPSTIFLRAKQPERLYRRNVAHFSASGHELYARVLARFVVQTVPGPWGSGQNRANGVEGRFSATDSPKSGEPGSSAIRKTGFNRVGTADTTPEGNRPAETQAEAGRGEVQ